MDNETLIRLADTTRGVIFCLYLIVIVQVGYIVTKYRRVLRLERKIRSSHRAGILPMHVVIVSSALIASLTMNVIESYLHVGEGFNQYSVFNPIILLGTVIGLRYVMQFEHFRYKHLSRATLRDLEEDLTTDEETGSV